MKIKRSIPLLSAAAFLAMAGCSSNDSSPATPEQKKAFGGSAPPADYMKNVQAGQAAGQKAAAEAAAAHSK